MSDVTSRAIKAAGGVAKLAAEFGISQPAIRQWKRIPAERVGKVAAITGISPHELRPDLFPQESAQ